ncbi:MAG TPA: hypothetical protein VGH38_18530, partial [Bryobacteraceae bacterium]
MAVPGLTEALLGFDVREMCPSGFRAAGRGEGWPTRFLLRTDLDDVFAADTIVWPSVFEAQATREWIGPNPPFWDDLAALRKAIPRSPSGGTPPWLIAATWHTDLGFPEEEEQAGKFLGPYLASTTPEQRDPAWRFLGFDITDGGFLSGLSDCGYQDEERAGLAEVWARHLNRYHLFDDLDSAFQFRAL